MRLSESAASTNGQHEAFRATKPAEPLLDVFKDELGAIQGEKAKLLFQKKKLQFCKASSVPFALRAVVEAELSKLEELGMISQFDSSEYATPIVPVIERDGSIRIFGDYKATVNPILYIERYSLLKADEVFAVLAGGEKFSNIDLSRAYQQVELAILEIPRVEYS